MHALQQKNYYLASIFLYLGDVRWVDEQWQRIARTLLLAGLHAPVPYGNSAGQSSKIAEDTKSTRKAVLHAASDVSNITNVLMADQQH